MGWSNSTFQLLIITASPSGFSGLFVYSPAPGPGNLIASIASTAGTDPYGNAYKAGITSQSGNTFGQLFNGTFITQNTAIANAAWQITPNFLANAVMEFANTVTGKAVFLNTSGFWVGEGSSIPEAWHTMSPLAAGFSAGSTVPRYRIEPIGSGAQVRLGGVINLTANQVAGATVFTMPALYTPTNSQFFISAGSLSGASNLNTSLSISSGSGILGILVSGTNGNSFALDGITYVLD